MTSLLLFVVATQTNSVTLPALFSDHMVLQRDRPARVWGWANAGEKVAVHIDRTTVRVTTTSDGDWSAEIPAHPAGGPFTLTVGNKVFKDVMFGDVWVCSGQSNMQMTVAQSNDAQNEVAAANYGNVRLFTVPMTSTESPLASNGGPWAVCSPQSVPDFSAVGYFFGRELATKTGVAVGLINTSWGGTPVESWTSRPALRRIPESKQWLETHLANVKAGKQGNNAGWFPGALYNAMIAPLTPFAIRGAIWYQGESNADKPELYSRTFPNMIRDWRSAWGQGDFPFYFVQLAAFGTGADWPRLREAQTKTLALPNTGMALAIDIGNTTDIHPKNKQDVGKRLALWAMRDVFGQNVEVSGPRFVRAELRNSSLLVTLNHAQGIKTTDANAILGFEVAGADKKFFPAKATFAQVQFSGPPGVYKAVMVSSDSVKAPLYVRYAWSSDPKVNLINGAGLPALPFRTDTD